MTYHWVMTLSWSAGRKRSVGSFASGLVDCPAGQTRSEVFGQLYKDAAASMSAQLAARGITATHPIVTFFALEPETLA